MFMLTQDIRRSAVFSSKTYSNKLFVMLMYWNNHNRLDLVADGFSQDDLLDVGNKTVMGLGFRKFPTGKSLTIIGTVL